MSSSFFLSFTSFSIYNENITLMKVALFFVGVNLSYSNEGVENSFLNIFEDKMKNIDI